jgi:hypothetical protein
VLAHTRDVQQKLTTTALCRYTIRVQAADGAGGWASQDVTLIVRKAGDGSGTAPCCRSTGLIIAQQLGRPIDPTTFRPPWLSSSAGAVGWEPGYLTGPEDLEAERLFDYSLLAPLDTGQPAQTAMSTLAAAEQLSCERMTHD